MMSCMCGRSVCRLTRSLSAPRRSPRVESWAMATTGHNVLRLMAAVAAAAAATVALSGCGGDSEPGPTAVLEPARPTIVRPAIQSAEPEPVETTPPEPVETTPPEPVETTPPEPVETTPPEPVETTPPEPVETTPPEPVETTPPEPVETTPPEPVETTLPEPVICDVGSIVLDKYVSSNGDGCRPEECEKGRTIFGWCLELDFDPPTTTTIAPERIQEPCPAPEGPTVFEGQGSNVIADAPVVTISAGVWRIEACLRDNNAATGEPASFTVSLWAVDGGTLRGGRILDVAYAVDGVWITDVPVSFDAPKPTRIVVGAKGGGSWVITVSAVTEVSGTT